jgi:Flp pilus assembly protein TadD/cold shock CspA family protein
VGEVIETPPNVSAAELLIEAEQAAGKKEWDQAADLLANAGDTTEVLDKRAFYLSRAGRYEEALAQLSILFAREPENFRWPYMIAYQHYAQERYQDAIPWFREALKRNPKHLGSWWRAAYSLSRSGEETKASACAGKVLRLWHELPQEGKERNRKLLAKASYFLGKMQMKNDPRGAIPLLEQALANDESDPHKHYRLGKAFRYAGRPDEAIAHLRRARKLNPADINIELELALCLSRTGEPKEALTIVRRRERQFRGWNLLKAGQLALDLEEATLAVGLLERAARDRATRKNERVVKALEAARALAPMSDDLEQTGGDKETSRGRVDVLRPERNFGFLVDERDGIRRHFRLRGNPRLNVGDRVTFRPMEGEKGPAASELRKA